MKPPDALFESVTNCAREPVARIASARPPRGSGADHHHRLGVVLRTSSESWAKSGLLRSYLPRKPASSLAPSKPAFDADQRIGAKGVIDMQHPGCW